MSWRIAPRAIRPRKLETAMHWILAKEDDIIFAIFGAIILGLLLIFAIAQVILRIAARFGPKKSFHEFFRRYFGRKFDELQTHDKKFPGYDLPSLHRAIASYLNDGATEVKELGGCMYHHLRDLFDR